MRLVSIHAPREGRDMVVVLRTTPSRRFQSTRPVRGATPSPATALYTDAVSIHAPREGRDDGDSPATPCCLRVSIHAPREGRDPIGGCVSGGFDLFQSTRPVRGATFGWDASSSEGVVSIHAPREGRDFQAARWLWLGNGFNPRAP